MIARPLARIDLALRALAVAVTAAVLASALHDVSQAWDSGYYHLPFAARLAGVVSPADFVFHPANEARFAGFPLLGERLQGLLWRVTGRAESANLVAFASVPLLAWLLLRRSAVPLHLSVLALFAIPLVQTHATSAYVDLPANVAVSAAVLLAIDAFASASPVSGWTLVTATAAAGAAANMKALLHPIAALALVALAVRVRGERAKLLAIAVALPLVFATPLANLVQHGNPYYPVRMSVVGHELPGTEGAYASSPPWLAGAPRPVRFACSLLEVGIRPLGDERRWSIDQWMPDDSTGNRMGGFFGAYVVLNLALLVWRVLRDRSREAYAAGAGLAALTVVVSVMPQSHELRYYMCWMIVLVALNLRLACASGGALPTQLGLGAALSLAIVVGVTRGAYVLPLGSSFQALVRAKVDGGVIDGLKDGERVCARREPWNLLWADVFHPPRRYVVVEAEDVSDCAGARPLE